MAKFTAVLSMLVLGVGSSRLQLFDSENLSSRSSSVLSTGKTKSLHIGGIFPMSGSWAGGRGCRPAVDMALSDINGRSDVLSGYRLEMHSNDSQCQPGLGMKVLYDLVYNKPVKLMVLGPGCSAVSTFVGQAARMWNLIVLSYGSSSPALSSRKRFPTFFRTHPSATLHNPTRIKLLKKFGWNRIATIQETQEVFASTMEDLEEKARENDIEISVRTNFLIDPTNAVRNLKRQDARIIVGLFYEDKARRVFCEAYKQKLYGPKHVWFVIGWYADNWYMVRDTNCTIEQMQEVLKGHFTTEGLMLNQNQNTPSISGMTSRDFTQRLERDMEKLYGKDVIPLSVTGYVEAPLAYDAVWALALALDKTQTRGICELRVQTIHQLFELRELKKKGKSLKQFRYSSVDIMEEIYNAMNSTNFIGVSGHVAFNSEGDRIALTQIEQMWDGNYTKVGFYNATSDNLTWFDNEIWLGDRKPEDRTTVETVLRTVHSTVYFSMCLLALLGILASLALLVYNVMHRKYRMIEMSQPQLNNILLVGCILCFSCTFLNGLDSERVGESKVVAFCQAQSWILSIGFTLAYGSMFSKVWAGYRVATQRDNESLVLKECELYAILGVLLALDAIILSAWQISNPFYRTLDDLPRERPETTDRDIELLPQLERCSSSNLYIWLGVVFGYKGILLLFGTLLVYETRNIKLLQVNDLRLVAMSMGNVLVLVIITVPVVLTISSHPDATFLFSSISILLCCFLSMGLIFLPKMFVIRKTSLSEDQASATLTNNLTASANDEQYEQLLRENEDLRLQIYEKEQRIRELKNQILMRRTAAQENKET